jgi:NAD(P)-dependent dehydrogenase (short-subunit alcohol dehydrogenase family)
MANLYAPKGIRVNCVTVGYLWNAITQEAKEWQAPDVSMEDYRRGRAEALNALQEEGDAWDVANAIAFFASDESRWITGQDLVVDGGYCVMNVFEHTEYGAFMKKR